MDGGSDTIDETRRHYDLHSNKHANQEQAIRERAQGGAIQLKKYHNTIKRELIRRFAPPRSRLLDLACGRGGDLRKWFDCQLSYVKAYDLSPGEIEEAKKRLVDVRQDRRYSGSSTKVDFIVTDQVGSGDLGLSKDEPYDAVSCMFAIHYFFANDATLHAFFRNASAGLRDRGYFFGTCPDGKCIMAELHKDGGDRVQRPMLKLRRMWDGPAPPPLGGKYSCHIADTVVEGHEGVTEGSVEYLVFFNVMSKVAEKYDLFPVVSAWGRDLEKLLSRDEPRGREWVKHFAPRFPGADPSLEDASRLFVAFAFQKREPVNRRHFQASEEHAAAVREGGGLTGKKRAREGGAE